MRAAIYTRVSTAHQNPELQLREIQEYASQQGWEIVETYQDIASGAKASRPDLNRLMVFWADEKHPLAARKLAHAPSLRGGKNGRYGSAS